MLSRAALALIGAYRLVGSPLLWFLGSRCRYEPSCSAYAAAAFGSHPFGRALRLSARRLSRCHPWGGHGYDPVPPSERHSGRRGA